MRKFYDDIFFPTLDTHSIKTVLHGGDYTDRRKYVNYGTARFMFDSYCTPMRKRGIREYGLVGNHDCYLKHTTSINSIEELRRDDDGLTVIKHPGELEIDNATILCLPWICDDNRDESLRRISDSRASIVLGHLQLAGFQMYKGQPAEDGLSATLFDRFELVMSGHFHHKSTSGPIHYLGAPYPMTWQDYRDPRGFHLFDTWTHALTFIENPYSIFVRLLYDDNGRKFDYVEELVTSIIAPNSPYRDAYVKVVVRTKTQPYWFDLIMDAFYKANVLDVVVVDDIVVNDDDTETRTVDAVQSIDTLALMKEYVDTLSISCDKNELNTYLRGLYTEALDADQSARLS
jgi:hypothetical protein